MNVYEVSEQKTDRKTVSVEAADEFSAVKAAHESIVGKPSVGAVTWHGLHAEIDGCRYNKPVLTWVDCQ